MDELLGFMVLTGPLFPMLIWLIVCVLLVVFVVRPTGSGLRRVAIKTLAFVVIFLLPFVDEIIGKTYLDYLCSTQGGFKVYKTVVLPDEYWDEEGEAKFINFTRFENIPQLDKVDGTLDFDVLPEYGLDSEDEVYSSVIGILVNRYWYFEKSSGEVLAEDRYFSYRGGWVARRFGARTGVSCDTSGQPNTKENILSLFVPAT